MFVDLDLPFLRDAAALVDSHLDRLDESASARSDPDVFGVADQVEYTIGYGFVACQTYLWAVISRRKLLRVDAFDCGPRHRTGSPMIALVDAAATYWKHQTDVFRRSPSGSPDPIGLLQALGVDTTQSQVVTSALYELVRPLPTRFATLIPFLEQWRDALPPRLRPV